ncbi:sodium/proline symporter [Woeseia oceani]|uniref:Sodium/proline symporter n=1 Tax=Woeseia oceani TaxID=1548547 RepID=A0A193LCM6_9GAMM|nr:sodium/proline symporter [Woeseia oceani]ANO50262.1 sodium:proline symporter [Woeseia oceani]
MIEASFAMFLLLFVGVGLASAMRAKKSRNDYYLASREIKPWLAGLSAVATNNSGYMFIGVIGFTYTAGMAAALLMTGWILGDFIGSLFIHKRLRQHTESTNEASFAAVMARWHGEEFTVWRRIAAVVMLIFLGSYAAAQISAGGKALQGVLGWDPLYGAVAVAIMVLAYSVAGGIRASIWTDAAQSMVMLAAMSTMLFVAVQGKGGLDATVSQLAEIPGYLDIYPDDVLLPGLAGVAMFVIGWMFAGFSVVGQPHVMVRFMALDDVKNLNRTRFWYYSYFISFYLLATGVGMLSRLYLPSLGDLDAELALPTMALELLPDFFVGMVLAGIFAATMSTADSLVLSCSAAVTHDLAPSRLEKSWQMKAVTAFVVALALGMAVSGSRSVFQLVIMSWSVLASAFAPLLTLYVLGRRISEAGAIVAMLAGVSTAIGWRLLGWHNMLYEGLPGILVGLLVALLYSSVKAGQPGFVTALLRKT